MKEDIITFFKDCFGGSRFNWLFFLGISLLLIWTPMEYGARYINTQVAAQVICGALILLLLRQNNEVLYRYPLWALSIFWIIVLFLSFVFSVVRLASLEELLRNLMYITLPMITFSWCTSQNRIKLLSYLIISVGLLVSLYALFDFFSVYISQGIFISANLPFTRTNDLGAYAILIFPLAFANFLYENESNFEKLYYGFAAILSFIVIILTFSRGIWLSTLLTLILLLILGRKIIRKNVFYLVPLAIASLTPIIVRWNDVVTRFLSLQNLFANIENSLEWRKSLLRGSLQIFADQPVFGMGLNSFAFVYRFYQERPGYFSINPHNYYLQLLAETGVVGFFTFCLMALSILYLSYKAFSNSKDLFKGISLGLLAGIISSLIHISLDIDWSVSAIPILFWVEVGLLMSIYNGVNFKDTRFSEFNERFNYLKRPVLIIFAIILIILPSMNYFSLNAYSKGYDAYVDGNYERAAKYNFLARKLAPWPSSKHHHNYALILEKEGKLPEAIFNIKKAIRFDRYGFISYKEYARLLIKENKNNKIEALNALKLAVSYNPYTHPSLYEDVADFYLEHLNDQEQAIEWYKKSITKFPLKYLPSYEHYVPDDRYQLYRIYKKLARILKDSEPEKADEYKQIAVSLLNTQIHIETISLGEKSATPTATIKNYWREIYKPGFDIREYLVHNAEVSHPPPGFKYEFVDFVDIIHNIFSVKIKYKILMTKDDLSKEIELIDQVVQTDNGWLLKERVIKMNENDDGVNLKK